MKYIFVIILFASLPSLACVKEEEWKGRKLEEIDTNTDGVIDYEEYKAPIEDKFAERDIKLSWNAFSKGQEAISVEDFLEANRPRCGDSK